MKAMPATTRWSTQEAAGDTHVRTGGGPPSPPSSPGGGSDGSDGSDGSSPAASGEWSSGSISGTASGAASVSGSGAGVSTFRLNDASSPGVRQPLQLGGPGINERR